MSETELPQIVNAGPNGLYQSPHALTTNVDPAYAGEYEITHGCVRIGEQIARTGARLKLSALDGHRMLNAGTVKRVDGKEIGTPAYRRKLFDRRNEIVAEIERLPDLRAEAVKAVLDAIERVRQRDTSSKSSFDVEAVRALRAALSRL